ncbi:hypothetical protein FACS1894152_5500 [Bacilli bacterium]|nr:hypothetical protein FACS1894152_5500 [Bacilli bacterium]
MEEIKEAEEVKKISLFYDRKNGIFPYQKWYSRLDNSVSKIVSKRVDRVRIGNYGVHRFLKGGVIELKLDQGLRVYLAEAGNDVVLLFCGGDKSDQQKDIEKAREYRKILGEKGLDYCLGKDLK